MIVNYTEVERYGPATLIVIGYGLRKKRVYTNQTVLDGIDAETVLSLLEKRSQLPQHVADYVRLRNQHEMEERGGRKCRQCDALFVPVETKPWNQDGFCSKSCAAQGGETDMMTKDESQGNVTFSPVLEITCSNGHEFMVLSSFSGCVRPCPECGEKTLVP